MATDWRQSRLDPLVPRRTRTRGGSHVRREAHASLSRTVKAAGVTKPCRWCVRPAAGGIYRGRCLEGSAGRGRGAMLGESYGAQLGVTITGIGLQTRASR